MRHHLFSKCLVRASARLGGFPITYEYIISGILSALVVPVIIVVIVALVLMVACICLMWRIVKQIDHSKKNSVPAQKAASAQAAAAPAPVSARPVQNDAQPSGEIVAAICAAVASMMQTPHAVTSIAPASPAPSAMPVRQRPVWGFAGMQQNTRPF